MAIQSNYEWITWSRARVLRELAQLRTEKEAAERLGIGYHGVRSIVEDIKHAQMGQVGGGTGLGERRRVRFVG